MTFRRDGRAADHRDILSTRVIHREPVLRDSIGRWRRARLPLLASISSLFGMSVHSFGVHSVHALRLESRQCREVLPRPLVRADGVSDMTRKASAAQITPCALRTIGLICIIRTWTRPYCEHSHNYCLSIVGILRRFVVYT